MLPAIVVVMWAVAQLAAKLVAASQLRNDHKN
jgi:hypothetical protein